MILVCGEALIDLFVGAAEGAEMPARAVAGGSPFNVAIGLAREKSELQALIVKRAAEFVCPPGYGPDDAMKHSDRLHQLNCQRMSPPARGGGELKGAEDEEEAFLTARVAAFWHSQEGRDRKRMRALELKGIRSPEEQKELDQLSEVYPEGPSESALAKAFELRRSQLRQRTR